MSLPDHQALARVRTQGLLGQAATHFGIQPPVLEISFDLRGTMAGQVRLSARGPLRIRYNAQLLAENGAAFLARTVPHEVAHVVARAAFGNRIRPHGPEWREVMEFFGADATRTHRYDTSRVATRQLRRFDYRCACRQHRLTSIRHRRVLEGQVYVCRHCGEQLTPTSGD